MKFGFWRKPRAAGAQRQRPEFLDEGPLVAQTLQEKAKEPQRAPQKVAPIAK